MLNDYIDNVFDHVGGWVERGIAPFLQHLAEVKFNQHGGVGEIGVHYGKFFYMLRSLLDSPEMSVAVDVFEDQHLNIDRSGFGSRIVFEQNMQYDQFGGENVIVIQSDSMSPMAKTALSSIEPLRFLSVDGGHTREHTMNDLYLAEDLVDAGVVILDDFLHNQWIGVTVGVLEYLSRGETLVPFAMGYNKLFMCKISYHQRYIDHLSVWPKVKTVSIYGWDVVCL